MQKNSRVSLPRGNTKPVVQILLDLNTTPHPLSLRSAERLQSLAQPHNVMLAFKKI